MNPFEFITLQSNISRLMFETQTVMSLRMMGMAGLLPARPDENLRMVSEKLPAMIRSAGAAQSEALRGGRPDQIMTAALEPLSDEVSANRKRLMK